MCNLRDENGYEARFAREIVLQPVCYSRIAAGGFAMTLLEAIQAVADGETVVSCVGKRYTPDMLAPIWTSNRCAAYATCGMTKEEREGAWETHEL